MTTTPGIYSNRGFTLTELMVAIAILAIVMAIAIPVYRDQVLRGNRTEAIDELMRQAAFQERQFSLNNDYSAVADNTTDSGNYEIETTAPGDGTFTIRANPQGPQTDDDCGWLEINHVGRRIAQGDNGECWAGQ